MTEIQTLIDTHAKPCPFCGGTELEFPPSIKVRQMVICSACGAEGPYSQGDGDSETYIIERPDAVCMWNKRHD